MPYTPPHLADLIVNYDRLKEYCHSDLSDHQDLAKMLIHVTDHIICKTQTPDADQEALHRQLMGAYVMALETIKHEYRLHSPQYSEGRVYSSGSRLYSQIRNLLKIDKDHKLHSRERLLYANEFHKLLTQENFSNKDFDQEAYAKATHPVLQRLLVRLTNPVAKVVNAIPTEESLSKHMKNMPEGYISGKAEANTKNWFFKSKPNPSRMFLTQLARAVSCLECDDDVNLPEGSFTRSQRIKMGMLLYIQKKIANSYTVRSPTNSVLYNQSNKVQNSEKEPNLTEAQQLACLTAFKSYIDDHSIRGELETFGRQQFGGASLLGNIDSNLEAVSNGIDGMQHDLRHNLLKNWPATRTGATIGAILGAAPGYGVGSVIGWMSAESVSVRPLTDRVGSGLNGVATMIMGPGPATGYYCHLTGDFIVGSTLSRAFAKVFEVVGMGVGGTAGGAVGFTFDLTHKALQKMCENYLNYYDHHPDEMRLADKELVKCLLELPPEIFADEQKYQIKYTAGMEEDLRPAIRQV